MSIATATMPRSARSPRRSREQSTSRVKTAVVLGSDTYRRLSIHCAAENRTASEVVAELIDRHLRRYVLQDRGAKPAAEANIGGQATTVEGIDPLDA